MDFILLQGATAAANNGGAAQLWSMPLMFGLMFLVMYFFIIRPNRRRQKAEEEFRSGLKKGDKVVTIGGIHGKVVGLDETTALMEIDNNVKIKVEKSALRAAGTPPTAEVATNA